MCTPVGEPDPTPHERWWIDLGDVAVVPLVEIPRLLIEPEEFFPGVVDTAAPRSAWYLEPPWYDPDRRRLVYTIQSFLILSPVGTVLVDGCVGAAKHRSRPEFHMQEELWLERLKETGVTPEQVSDVVLTHLHVDHVGWSTRWVGGRWRPMFPSARHHVTGPELDYWRGDSGRAATARTGDYMSDSVEPLAEAGLLRVRAMDEVVDRHVRLVPAVGHTPGNVCVQVSGSNARLLITGDTVHHPLQLSDPRVSTRYCVDPHRAAITRRDLLGRAAETGTSVLPSHFAAPSVGRVSSVGEGFEFEPALDLLRTGPPPRSRSPRSRSEA